MSNPNNMGKQIKDLGTLIIVVGIIMTAMVILGIMNDGDSNSIFFIIFANHLLFMVVGSLLCFLLGIIIRSIGKHKEYKEGERINTNMTKQ